MPQERKPGQGGRKDAPAQGDMLSVGVTFTASILGFLYLGQWLDRKLGTSPLLLLVGLFTGFGLGVLWMYRRLVVRDKEKK